MNKIPAEIKQAIENQEIFPVATRNDKGIPNVVYIKYLKVVDDHTVLIADNYLHKTRENIQNNAQLSFVVLKPDCKGSFQLKGTAKWLIDGPLYGEVQKWVPDKYPRTAAVVVHVERIYDGSELLV